MTPPPTEEVIREVEDGETEQVQNEGLPPQPTPEMINQVLAYLSALSNQGQAPQVFSAPTLTSARQEASEPATGAVARGRTTARVRGRGRGRTSSRGRGQASSPSDARAVTPPPTEDVVREGEEGENEQVKNEELPPQPTPEMINQVLACLSGLSDQCQAPPVFSAPTPPV